MSARTSLRLANGRDIDLLAPVASDYADLAWRAEHLAKEARYNGATPGVFYSVAQHVSTGASAILDETGDERLAAYFSVHDDPESVLRDDTTPKKNAIVEIAEERFGVLGAQILAAFNELTDRHDQAVHEAAGLAWPPTPYIAAQCKYWDLRMFVTEWRDLMGNASHPDWGRYAGVEPLKMRIVPDARWQDSAQLLHLMWMRLLPKHQREAPPAFGRGAV
jgi:hypothetical protein